MIKGLLNTTILLSNIQSRHIWTIFLQKKYKCIAILNINLNKLNILKL